MIKKSREIIRVNRTDSGLRVDIPSSSDYASSYYAERLNGDSLGLLRLVRVFTIPEGNSSHVGYRVAYGDFERRDQGRSHYWKRVFPRCRTSEHEVSGRFNAGDLEYKAFEAIYRILRREARNAPF